MKKRVLGMHLLSFAIFLIIFMPFVIAAPTSIDSEIKKITYYAQEYETGNINYIQFLIYSNAVREKINELMGAKKIEGGLLREEQLKSVFGEPTEKTKWVWVEKEEREKKLDNEISVWRKIIFDGSKIQVWLNAWPSLFRENDELIYRLHFNTDFKKPKEELNINERISEIKTAAEDFNKEPTSERADNLARKSVNVEKTFESFMRQNKERCEDSMKKIFGSENIREKQKLIMQEIEFFEGKDFELKMRLELCDECEWNWINLDFWIEGRGPQFKEPEVPETGLMSDKFKSLTEGDFENAVRRDLENLKLYLEKGDFNSAAALRKDFQQLNEEWNRKANDVWQQVESGFKSARDGMSQKQLEEYDRNYGWLREDQQKKEEERKIRKDNYNKRKQFYNSLFSDYKKKEFYFEQMEYEKRLVEEFREFGKEICDNNKDDNKNNKIDCSEEQCSGKICGRQKISIQKNNETIEEVRDLFCITGECKLKEEIVGKEEAVCGNHVCELGEEKTCNRDCLQCKSYEALECSGNVIFKGKDENECPLEPICLNETDYCYADNDCTQPLCGRAECIENKCKVTTLNECREPECIDGDEKIQNCESGEKIVVEKCIEGIWRNTGTECKKAEKPWEGIGSCEKKCATLIYPACVGELKISGTYPECVCDWICKKEPIVENECVVKEDCGNPDDVCSNGKCVAIPKVIKESEEERLGPQQEGQSTQEEQAAPEEQKQEEQAQTEVQPQTEISEQKETITAQIIKTIRSITGKITGLVITGFNVEEDKGQEQLPPQQTEQSAESDIAPSEETQQEQQTEKPVEQQLQQPQEEEKRRENEREEKERDERERKENEDAERRARECNERCSGECMGKNVMPCVDQCVRNAECKDKSCVDKKIKECEVDCKREKNFDGCIGLCTDKCKKGEKFEIAEEREEHKEEKGVFKVGGTCRTSQQKTESFIFFDGWGESFEQIRFLKTKYYSGGQAEWCKNDLESLTKQRKELELGLTNESLKWFFEKYLANSAEEWEQHISGIFELYWRDVDISREIAYRMRCLNKKEFDFAPNLIHVKYETEFGKLEFWEEIKIAKIPGLENEINIISPYMKIWIFPPKEFIKYEMKKSMKNREFPGPPEEKLERKRQEGPTEEEKAEIRKDKAFMKEIKKLSDKYGGNIEAAIQFKDYAANEIVFNLYAQMNEQDILKVEPMLPEEVPQKDVTIEIDFEKIYEIIYISEKEMRGEELESPPWDKKPRTEKIKEIFNGIKVYFKVRSLINDAKIYPESEEKNVRKMMKKVFTMMMKEEADKGEEDMSKEEKKDKFPLEDRDDLTGKIIYSPISDRVKAELQ